MADRSGRTGPGVLPSDATRHITETSRQDWLRGLRAYLAVAFLAHLVWETLQLPLYTLWTTATLRDQVFAVLHCTGGDILIALSAIVTGLVLAGSKDWPRRTHRSVLLITLFTGIAYTIFSEWLNVHVRASWEYSSLMPTLPVLGTGLSPLLQWIVVPLLAMTVARRTALAS